MKMEQLPAELQIEALSYLDNTDLKAARAVSTKLRDHASPLLFRSIVACARYKALGAFQKILTNPVLQRYVKQIVFDGSVFSAELANSFDRYGAENDKYDHLCTMSSFWSKKTRWRRYKELYIEQEDLKTSRVLLHTIARALEEITGLSSIVYSPRPHLIPVEAQEMRDLVPRHFEAGLADPRFPIHIHSNQSFRLLEHPFLHLIGAIYAAQYIGVRELRVEAFNTGDHGTPFTFDTLVSSHSATELEAGLHLFRHLERCELDLKVWHHGPASTAFSVQGKTILKKLLAVSDELRHLALRLSGWEAISVFSSTPGLNLCRSTFKFMGLQKRWPKLRSLALEGVNGSEEDFLDLITRHKYTLTSLSIRNCSLQRGIWANVVDEVVYSTRIFSFVLNSVWEAQLPASSGLVQISNDLEEWKYVGQLEISKDGERTFVEPEAKNRSVYSVYSGNK